MFICACLVWKCCEGSIEGTCSGYDLLLYVLQRESGTDVEGLFCEIGRVFGNEPAVHKHRIRNTPEDKEFAALNMRFPFVEAFVD